MTREPSEPQPACPDNPEARIAIRQAAEQLRPYDQDQLEEFNTAMDMISTDLGNGEEIQDASRVEPPAPESPF